MHMKKEKNKKNNSQKIFIVEDDPDICELMETIIQSLGYQVQTFKTGTVVERTAMKETPLLIFLDLWMPGIDGLTVLKNLKSNEITCKIPVVIVSAKNSLDKVARQNKADAFLSKPFDIKDLDSIIKKFVK